jgi:putative ABC transport system permease protein
MTAIFAWAKIALRNLAKNRRRTLFTILAISLGYAAVNLFNGFTQYIHNGNREVAIYGLARGHLTIIKKGGLDQGKLDPHKFLLTPEEIDAVLNICRKMPEVILVTPQLQISGLLSDGKVSTIFIGQGIVPSSIDIFRDQAKHIKNMVHFEGRQLSDDQQYGVAVAKGLAELLDLDIGSYAVAMSTTVDGQMNALDMEILQIFVAASEELNDKAVRVPFQFAQNLYDTKGAGNIAVLLQETHLTGKVKDQLLEHFKDAGLDLDIKTWVEMSPWYSKVKDMFDIIFLFLFVIVFIIVVMSVINTMSMAVLERTREIGTLRALGLKRSGVMLLFGIESSLLGLCGTAGGIILNFLGKSLIVMIEPTWVPPGMSKEVPLTVEFTTDFMLISFGVLLALCLLSSLVPARRAARQNVVDALGHV